MCIRDSDWIDPILKTPLTKGEVGCFLSHWRLWEKCIELNEPILILEDDAVCTDRFNIKDSQTSKLLLASKELLKMYENIHWLIGGIPKKDDKLLLSKKYFKNI